MSAAIVSRDTELTSVIALWLGDAGIMTETYETPEAASVSGAELFITDGERVAGQKTLLIVADSGQCDDGTVLLRPFTQTELLSAVRVMLDAAPGMLFCDSEKKRAVYRSASVQLTNKECELLELLLRNGAEGVSREEASLIARRDGGLETNAAEVYIHHLRRKMTTLTGGPVIKTVRGRGYVIGEI